MEEKTKESMLDLHSKTFEERRTLLNFIEWLNQKEMRLCEIPECYKDRFDPSWMPITKNDDSLLDDYFEIDAAQLETERRALLEEARKMNAEKTK